MEAALLKFNIQIEESVRWKTQVKRLFILKFLYLEKLLKFDDPFSALFNNQAHTWTNKNTIMKVFHTWFLLWKKENFRH